MVEPLTVTPAAESSMDVLASNLMVSRSLSCMTVLAARGMNPASFEGYLEAFKHGMPPHGGFAIGLERWVARLIEAPNIRETTLFPRDLTRLSP